MLKSALFSDISVFTHEKLCMLGTDIIMLDLTPLLICCDRLQAFWRAINWTCFSDSSSSISSNPHSDRRRQMLGSHHPSHCRNCQTNEATGPNNSDLLKILRNTWYYFLFFYFRFYLFMLPFLININYLYFVLCIICKLSCFVFG